MPGSFINQYRLVEKIGVGGMGEVYRAEDTKLKRQVAIKVLPEDLSRDVDLMERFEREARILASLNHPNVAAIYDLAESGGTRALVLELVEGPTLLEHIHAAAASGQSGLPLREALGIALQIALGLEAAHERGIVHRDLKPANVKLTPDGKIKILDFGLGKSVAPEGGDGVSSDSSGLGTVNRPTTGGMILGTAAYMPPEQARGKSVDKRADIWSFGVVLYEMLSGVPMFEGETVTDVLAAVIGRDPDWGAFPRSTPPRIRHLLARCLERDTKKRLRDIGEARVVLEESLAQTDSTAPYGALDSWDKAARFRAAPWVALSMIVAVVAFLAGSSLRTEPPEQAMRLRARIVFASDVPLFMGMRPSLALSPDGAWLVVASQQSGVSQLYRRSLAEGTVSPIRGTEGASGPFFSPDGRFLGFFTDGKLKKVSADGGTPLVLADCSAGQGGSFAPDGSVVFSPVHGEGLFRVPADGGPAEALISVDRAAGEGGHHWPQVLPDGRNALVTVEVTGKPYSEARIALVSLETKKLRVLLEGGSDARYVSTGHIVYWSGGELWAVSFDLDELAIRGAPFPVTPDVMAGEPNGFAQYSFSNDGTLVYVPGRHPMEERRLMLIDRNGAARPLSPEERNFEHPRVSPDGRRLAVSVAAADDSLWVYELDRGTLARMTFEHENRRAVWSPSGDRLAFLSHAGGPAFSIQVAPLDGSAAPEAVRESDRPENPESWTANGNLVAFTRRKPETGSDVWLLPLSGDEGPRAFLDSRFEEAEARFSPDGRWLAYQSDESGRPEVYVSKFPGPGGKRRISVDGGAQPRWRGDGREIFFRRGATVMAVDVPAGGPAETSVPRPLFESRHSEASLDGNTWDVFADGKGFVFIEEDADPRTSVELELGWFDELRALER